MGNKKVALVTCYFQKNFGSQLQAYATQMIFDSYKLQNETISFDGISNEIKTAKYKYFLKHIFDINTVKDKLSTVRKFCARIIDKEYAKNLSIRNEHFKQFEAKFNLSKVYTSKHELSKYSEQYSAFVVGSDQLWLPSNIYADYYTLNFVPEHICKISYSTSFGVSSLPPRYGKMARHFLNRFDYISVREQSGKDIVKQWSGRDVSVVCDPTILFTSKEWADALDAKETGAKFSQGEKYIFVYFLGNNPWERSFVKKIQRSTGYKIVQIAHCDEFVKSDIGFADYVPYNVGPKEFFELIRDAELVFTDSYHCSVFSILNHKVFYSFPRYSNDSSVSTNGRLYSLLSSFKLNDRMITRAKAESFDTSVKNWDSIDYDMVDTLVSGLRSSSRQWLEASLSEKGIL